MPHDWKGTGRRLLVHTNAISREVGRAMNCALASCDRQVIMDSLELIRTEAAAEATAVLARDLDAGATKDRLRTLSGQIDAASEAVGKLELALRGHAGEETYVEATAIIRRALAGGA